MNLAQVLRDNLPLIILLSVLALIYFFLRTKPSDVDSMEELENTLRSGTPTVLEFFSNT